MSRERAELSKKNPYHIPRYRYYELKYFCRQYNDWKKALTLIDGWQTSPNDISGIIKGCPPESPTERIALSRVFYSSCIDIVDLLRKLVNTDLTRSQKVLDICMTRPRVIIFYNFDYELDILMNLPYGDDAEVAQWNGHKHQPIPDGKKWVYLVQYNAE